MWVMCLIDSDTVPTGILGIMVSCVILSAVRLFGVLLKVYIKDVHVSHVSLIDSNTVPTGILGIMVSCVILSAVRLVGVLLIVYIKDVHVGHVSIIDSDTVPTGILGIYYGKWCHFVSCTVSWCSIDSVHQRCTCGSCVSLI